MLWWKVALSVAVSASMAGCSSLVFSDGYRADGVTFYDPVPALVLTCDKDKAVQVNVTSIPGRVRSVRPQSGIVGGKLSVSFSNGMVTTFNQEPQSLGNDMLTTLLEVAGLGVTSNARTPGVCPLDAPAMVFLLRYDSRGVVEGLDRMTIPLDAWARGTPGRRDQ
ncbi:hypothetical protein [Brevundimonas sp. A19_0]|uniref:hypothetical protein n=1 Tax=Brevundimonas sp. A19_0 TaxID=2821087 RepID=UPI001AD96D78|nr:hypothetical protein [Brevundimonas sp. A19_0]MBO9500137.1 hypothetical protein [Brevundimonas sp. A19_0]